MNPSDDNQHDVSIPDPAFLELVVRYQDGTLNPAEVEQLAELLCRDPERQRMFRRIQIRTAAIHDLLRMDAFGQVNTLLNEGDQPDSRAPMATSQESHTRSARSVWSIRRRLLWTGAAALSLIAGVSLLPWVGPDHPPATPPKIATVSNEDVILVDEDRAKFFGQQLLLAGDVVTPLQDYLLQSGLVRLKFPSGAETIVEAPAIFRVASKDQLILNSGACSVHAPPGAEGFEVITPVTKVIDRGTRFFVRVQENNETEVHVIEGAADLLSNARSAGGTQVFQQPVPSELETSAEPVRLTHGEAMRMGGFADKDGKRTKFRSEGYRAQLPDRLVKYEASSTSQETADELQSITVQRNGHLCHYPVTDLIPISVTWFQGDPKPEQNGYLCGFFEKPTRPEDWLEDRRLTTGLINFGGQPLPLNHTPVISSESNTEGTPGLGIRFSTPVVNHPGPDVVLLEIQPFSSRPEGDSFHVYPMSDRPGLKPHTVVKYDVTMESPAVRRVAPLWSHRYPEAMQSLEQLASIDAPLKLEVSSMHFFVVGVGIDLSSLGYAEGEEVQELFFQHASDEKGAKVDPVFIAGLPPLIPEE
ncbi:FecR domain-containing protein [Planctomicrobium sp. SH661]|uniref:FecR domain-containing protein n=1 Tax=Planctomicrobium sp. SH661 TaxID=3448124 RepID=UPI003F5B0173